MTDTPVADRRSDSADLADLVAEALDRVLAAGADSADVIASADRALSAHVRLGALESVERAEQRELGVRAFVGQRQATVATAKVDAETLATVAERAVAMARQAPEDAYAGLSPDGWTRDTDSSGLDLYDTTDPDADTLADRSRAAEDTARSFDGITNAEGAETVATHRQVALATSAGFAGSYWGSSFSLYVSTLAGADDAMVRDYAFTRARHWADLDAAEAVGRLAAERTLARRNARKVGSQKVPVVFDARVAHSLLGHLAQAINGASVARGTSFLADKRGERVFAPGVQVVDDPHRVRGLKSRPFDGEGLATRRRALIDDGVLTGWLLNLSHARQLGLEPTGNASRGIGGPPGAGASNLYLTPGDQTPAQLMADIGSGLYVTELMGMGVNPVTGDYSRGAAGFWIENGQIAYPVHEVTIAGNLKDMFASLTPADDLTFLWGTDAPTVRIDAMAVAGT
ncbi:modulator protein [Rhodothalassium salexigens]|uniref:TldD/PmbA family protein n=1 Tax=Rhodothalassium salexigens TaxID=1086 RepID=UPI00191215FA|nr:TldD/PmbA family protein [Rhodothalassium salexigens]MBK5909984.1 modulator protein [Rhodothalassium salexigens]